MKSISVPWYNDDLFSDYRQCRTTCGPLNRVINSLTDHNVSEFQHKLGGLPFGLCDGFVVRTELVGCIVVGRTRCCWMTRKRINLCCESWLGVIG